MITSGNEISISCKSIVLVDKTKAQIFSFGPEITLLNNKLKARTCKSEKHD
jgi:hypothetical protein